jgi:ABC-type transporter Mla subunit MlaD
MALQDLTPQLRTRLSRLERAVGWFVLLATALLIFGFGYYIYNRAETKGWFLKKITYQTCVSSGAGLKVGDPVKLMGFDVGDITDITPNDPYAYYNITVTFRVKADQKNYPGYIWSDSKVKVNAGDFLGNRYLEIVKGVEGVPTVWQSTNNQLLGILKGHQFIKARRLEWQRQGKSESDALALLKQEVTATPALFYTNRFREHFYFLEPVDSPAITERLEKFVAQIEAALPNVLQLTNQIALVLSNSASLTANLDAVALSARPAVSNLAFISAQLNQPGALGEWLLPTNLNQKLDTVLTSADTTLDTANTNLALLAQNLNQSLENLSLITSNLNGQVQANTNILSEISRAIIDADNLVQGLKKHWLLRSAFKPEKAPPAAKPPSAKRP